MPDRRCQERGAQFYCGGYGKGMGCRLFCVPQGIFLYPSGGGDSAALSLRRASGLGDSAGKGEDRRADVPCQRGPGAV